MRIYEYKHVVSLEETNVVRNVYFAHYFRWQGLCRERFLLEHAPSVARSLGEDLVLVTTRCTCDFLEELQAFDEVTIRMLLRDIDSFRISMDFEYLRGGNLVAKGFQQIACMRRYGMEMRAEGIPQALRDVLT
jgi:enediyne core biosynthesis thioesterase